MIAAALSLAIALGLAFCFAALGDFLLRRDSRDLRYWNQSFLVGAGLAATLLFPLSLVFRGYTLKIVLAGLSAAALLRLVRLRDPLSLVRPLTSARLAWPCWLLFAVVALLAADFTALSLRFPYAWDGFDIWATKAMVLLHHGRLTSELWPPTPSPQFNITRVVAYPNLVPMYQALLAQIRGFDWALLKAVFPIFYGSLLISVYHAARSLLSRPQALVTVILVELLPALSGSSAFGGYADMPLAAGLAAVLAAALDSDTSAFPWAVAALMTIKSEGLVLAGVATACAAVFTWTKSRDLPAAAPAPSLPAGPRTLLPAAAIIAAAAALRWIYVAWTGVQDPDFALAASLSSGVWITRVPMVVASCAAMLFHFDTWALFWPAFFLAAVILAARGNRPGRVLAAGCCAALLIYTFIYLFSGSRYVPGHIAGSYDRLLSQIAPAAALSIVLAWRTLAASSLNWADLLPRRAAIVSVAACIALLVALNLYLFRDHWRGSSSFPYDFPLAYYAFIGYWTTSLQMGEWPHWIPYQSMGYPAALNPQLGLFYPPFWIFVILRLPYTLHAANIVQALHVLFGSIGFWCFARRFFRLPVALAGAVAFAVFGGFYTNAEHPDIIRGFAWVPWLLWSLLLNERPAVRLLIRCRIVRWQALTRIRTPNLFLPLVVACFITGVYPGLMLAGLLMCGTGILASAAAGLSADRRAALRDAAMQCAQVALGIGMALVYLLPTLYLSSGLMRTHNYGKYSPWYLHAADFYQLFLPSSFVTTEDYSMHGMQLPMVLLLFLPFAVRARKGLLAPILAIASVSAVMCFEGLRPVSEFIASMAPVFRLSRFPAGDYRSFVYAGVLICALAGLEYLAYSPRRENAARWRNAGILIAALAALLIPCFFLFARPLPPIGRQSLPLWLTVEGTGCLLVAAAYLFVRPERLGTLWVHAITAGCILVSIPTLNRMKDFWSDPNIEAFIYDGQGLPLKGPDHRPKVQTLFSVRQIQRPARVDAPPPSPDHYPVSWRGYIDGTYMTSDRGSGSNAAGLAGVAGDASLAALMRRPGELLEVDCTAALCDGGDASAVSLAGRPAAGKSLEYSRNYVVYEVDVQAASLVVENEMYAPGWSGYCEIHGERLAAKRIDGALRGWVLGPGRHRLKVTYRTPLLMTGAVLSTIFAGGWLGSVILWLRAVRSRSAARRLTPG